MVYTKFSLYYTLYYKYNIKYIKMSYYSEYDLEDALINLNNRFTNFQNFIILFFFPMITILFILFYLVLLKLRIKVRYMRKNVKLLLQSRLNQGTLVV